MEKVISSVYFKKILQKSCTGATASFLVRISSSFHDSSPSRTDVLQIRNIRILDFLCLFSLLKKCFPANLALRNFHHSVQVDSVHYSPLPGYRALVVHAATSMQLQVHHPDGIQHPENSSCGFLRTPKVCTFPRRLPIVMVQTFGFSNLLAKNHASRICFST